jgi:hypothetical protein
MDGQPERVNYFFGQLLGVDDYLAEQEYHRGMRHLHNRLLHGWGIVDGLDVEGDGGGVLVRPGFALDSLGRELLLPEPVHVDLPPEAAVDEPIEWYVVATWEEIPAGPIAGGDDVSFSRWIERCAISIGPVAPEDDGPALLLATVTAAAGKVVDIDASQRRAVRISRAIDQSAVGASTDHVDGI